MLYFLTIENEKNLFKALLAKSQRQNKFAIFQLSNKHHGGELNEFDRVDSLCKLVKNKITDLSISKIP